MRKLGPRKETHPTQAHTVNINWGRTQGPHTSLPRDMIPSTTLYLSSFGLGWQFPQRTWLKQKSSLGESKLECLVLPQELHHLGNYQWQLSQKDSMQPGQLLLKLDTAKTPETNAKRMNQTLGVMSLWNASLCSSGRLPPSLQHLVLLTNLLLLDSFQCNDPLAFLMSVFDFSPL